MEAWQSTQAPMVYGQPQPQPQPQPKRKPSGWGIFFLSCIALGAITFAEVIGYFIGLLTPIGEDLGSLSLGAIVGIIAIVALGGARLLSPTKESFKTCWKVGWWFIAISVVLMLLDIVSILSDESFYWDRSWFMRLIETALLCIVIGIGEETMVRGVVLGGLLAPLGKSKRGMWIAIVLSSLYFGLLHIDFYTTDFSDMLQLAQAVLKVLQTGVYGFALACLTVTTEDIFSLAFLHGLDDFLLFIPAVVMAGETAEAEYVYTDTTDALFTIAIYAVMIALYLPVAIKAAKLLISQNKTSRGAFYEKRHPEDHAIPPAMAYGPQPYGPQPLNYLGFANNSQNATAEDAATFNESTSLDMGMTTQASEAATISGVRP